MCNFCNDKYIEIFDSNNSDKITDIKSLVNYAVEKDKERFIDGKDIWGELNIKDCVAKYVFGNKYPDYGFLLFILACWLSAQQKYTRVWSSGLEQLNKWVFDNGKIPRGNFITKYSLEKTISVFNKKNNISAWFINVIYEIVVKHGKASGNLYRFVGKLGDELFLYGKNYKNNIGPLLNGKFSNTCSGGHQKRLWMFVMCLRRDKNIIKCLFSRAIRNYNSPKGKKVLENWYDDGYFNPNECELPVDNRVSNKWHELAERIPVLSNGQLKKRYEIAKRARDIAKEYNVSPSVFDVLFFSKS